MTKMVQDFVESYKAKRFINTPQGLNEKAEWLRGELAVKNYIPFMEKRQIAEMIVAQNIKVVDGVKKYDSIGGYISLIVASIGAHTNLTWGANPIADYDLLVESGLLMQIIEEFKGSHDEIDMILKMALASELEDNNLNVLVGKFLDNILKRLDIVGETLKNTLGEIDIKDILGANFKEEDLAKLRGFLNTYNK
jgi:hypothetical protein